MTEHLELDTTWAGVIGTGKEIHDCMAAGWNAYLWWYIMRYYGPMDEAGSVTKRGYVMSQFSRFVRPGYIRIQCGSRPQQNVYLTAYKDSLSGRAVLVALNLGSSPVQQEFSIPGGGWTSFTPYLTTRSKSCWRGTDLPFTGGRFTATLEGSSITTFVAN
jgi:glucuronoarabinoxylan endo-1,4-beta-xylanase